MADLCEWQKSIDQEDENGNALPPLIVPCTQKAKYIVRRNFSGITQQLCATHTRRYRKDGTGAYVVASIQVVGA